jgi:hypothetical protein
MTFHVGQKVVCVKIGKWVSLDAGPRPSHLPRKGQIFTIAKIVDARPLTFLRLDEISKDADGNFHVFEDVHFRPVKTNDISVFRAMLVPSPKQRAEVD